MAAAAFLDVYLESLIRMSLVPLGAKDTEALFGPDRPLGTFSSRIRIAQALGIFGPKTAHDLNIMREIRNAFAHVIRKINFDTPEVKELIISLHCVRGVDNYRGLSSRKLFVEVTAILLSHIYSKREHVVPRRVQVARSLRT
jgi:DNA-binding MltR family transcriptional regulator